MRILIDTDFLVALIKEDDENYLRAMNKLNSLKDALFFVTPLIIPETVTVLSYKVSHQSARMFLKQARKKFPELPLNEKIIDLTDKIFLSQNKKRTSWVDCLNVATVKYYKLDGIISFDKFYSKLKLKVF